MTTHFCSIIDKLEIVQADISAFNALKAFHYRDSMLGPYKKIFAVTPKTKRLPGCFDKYLGVIVYSMPSPNCQLRTIATNGKYNHIGDKTIRLDAINRDIRCISRVIIEPRIRGIGVGAWLVRQTLPMAQTPIVEALAIMGDVNPFFEKAGMKKFTAALPTRCVMMREALSAIGIEDKMLLQPSTVLKEIENLKPPAKAFIINQINKFLQSYGRKIKFAPLAQQVKYLLNRLTHRPVYYIWHDKDINK